MSQKIIKSRWATVSYWSFLIGLMATLCAIITLGSMPKGVLELNVFWSSVIVFVLFCFFTLLSHLFTFELRKDEVAIFHSYGKPPRVLDRIGIYVGSPREKILAVINTKEIESSCDFEGPLDNERKVFCKLVYNYRASCEIEAWMTAVSLGVESSINSAIAYLLVPKEKRNPYSRLPNPPEYFDNWFAKMVFPEGTPSEILAKHSSDEEITNEAIVDFDRKLLDYLNAASKNGGWGIKIENVHIAEVGVRFKI